MPPKQKKASREKKQNQKDHQKQTSSDSSSITSPTIATTNYREIHQLEVEALRSIYGDDYQDVETRRSAWQVGVNR
jgi:translation initiation factor 2-alpha kinase 4